MPTASTVSKSTPTNSKTGTRKTRTRKAKATTKATPKKSVPVAKVTVTTFKSGKAVSKVTTLKRPSTRNLITPERYIKDIQTRWQIHQYEIQELLRDLNKGLTFVTPYHDQLVKQVKAWTVWKLTFFTTIPLQTGFFCAWSFRLSVWINQLWTSFFPLYFKRVTQFEKSTSLASLIWNVKFPNSSEIAIQLMMNIWKRFTIIWTVSKTVLFLCQLANWFIFVVIRYIWFIWSHSSV